MNWLMVRKAAAVFVLSTLVLGLAACGSSLTGTYTNASGLVMVELRSGGQATVTEMGQTNECTYDVADKDVTLTCAGDKSVFRRNGDGSLIGPGFVGVLTKGKN